MRSFCQIASMVSVVFASIVGFSGDESASLRFAVVAVAWAVLAVSERKERP